jgi:hypothetical protein
LNCDPGPDRAPGLAAALLLNLEGMFTVTPLLAWFVFREGANRGVPDRGLCGANLSLLEPGNRAQS